jgi:hypothetical protein
MSIQNVRLPRLYFSIRVLVSCRLCLKGVRCGWKKCMQSPKKLEN